MGYVLVKGDIFWRLVTPLAALTVRRVDSEKLKIVIALATIMLGTFTLAGAFIF